MWISGALGVLVIIGLVILMRREARRHLCPALLDYLVPQIQRSQNPAITRPAAKRRRYPATMLALWARYQAGADGRRRNRTQRRQFRKPSPVAVVLSGVDWYCVR